MNVVTFVHPGAEAPDGTSVDATPIEGASVLFNHGEESAEGCAASRGGGGALGLASRGWAQGIVRSYLAW